MRKRTITAVLGASATAVIAPLTLLQVANAGAAAKTGQQEQPAAITIQSWVYVVPSEDVLSGTLWACTKISGAITDVSGGPTWESVAAYEAPTKMTGPAAVTAAGQECSAKVPAGGFVHVPPPEPGQYQFAKYTATPGASAEQSTGLTSLYSDQTIAGDKGDIDMTIASTYNFTDRPVQVGSVTVQPFTTGPGATWVITGGTGAYTGLQGSGTWFGNAATIPWIYRVATGQVWWARSSGAS
jgi:hypothetical protein